MEREPEMTQDKEQRELRGVLLSLLLAEQLRRDVITDFCGHRGASEPHLVVAAELERYMAALW